MKQGGAHTVHFPPAAEPEKAASAPNILETYAAALRDVELMREKLRGLIVSTNRHGDLPSTLSRAYGLTGILVAHSREDIVVRCTDCHQLAGAQHKPSCHRQGIVTTASDYTQPGSPHA